MLFMQIWAGSAVFPQHLMVDFSYKKDSQYKFHAIYADKRRYERGALYFPTLNHSSLLYGQTIGELQYGTE